MFYHAGIWRKGALVQTRAGLTSSIYTVEINGQRYEVSAENVLSVNQYEAHVCLDRALEEAVPELFLWCTLFVYKETKTGLYHLSSSIVFFAEYTFKKKMDKHRKYSWIMYFWVNQYNITLSFGFLLLSQRKKMNYHLSSSIYSFFFYRV